jgi:hypothetical protein
LVENIVGWLQLENISIDYIMIILKDTQWIRLYTYESDRASLLKVAVIADS